MPMDRRLQLLLDEDRYQRVAAAAKRQRVSVATVIRDAIDSSLPSDDKKRASAAAFILAAEPMPVPPVDELRAEVSDRRPGT
jgi:hypothetical protein